MGEVFLSRGSMGCGKSLLAFQRFMEYMDRNPGSKVCIVTRDLTNGTKVKMKMKRNQGTIIFISGNFKLEP